MKRLATATAALAVSVSGVFAQEANISDVTSFDLPAGTLSSNNDVTMFTIEGGNTDGSDLRCLSLNAVVRTPVKVLGTTQVDAKRFAGLTCDWAKGPTGMGN